MDIQLWRARIGTFHGMLGCCRPSPARRLISEKSLSSFLLKIFCIGIFFSRILSGLFIHMLLLGLIVLDIFGTALLHCMHVSILGVSILRLPSKITSFSFCLLFSLNSPFISIIIRSLLVQSGNIETNPGPPPPKLLSFGVWNVDSLLTRDGVKKSYIESLQSLHNFDIFSLCETYLTDKTHDGDLEMENAYAR